MIIKNGTVYQEDKNFARKDLFIENGIIVENIGQVTDRSEIDASGLLVLPGLIDIHSHGAVGHDFSDGNMEGMGKILAYEYAHGITTYCPTSMTIDREELERIFEQMGDFSEGEQMAQIGRAHV